MDTTWDIFFFSDSKIDSEEILDFFKEQPNIHIRKNKAEYYNKYTKTEFVFEYHKKHEKNELIPLSMTLDLLMMNSAHAHEAAKVAGRLCSAMNLKIFFPFTMSTHGEDFTKKRFLERWARNKDKIKDSYMKHQLYKLQSKQLVNVWKWNYNIPWTRKFLNDSVEIPEIQYASFDGKLASFVYFDPQTASALPEADFYIIIKSKSTGLIKKHLTLQKFILSQETMQDALSQMRFMPFDDAPFYKYQSDKLSQEIEQALKSSLDFHIQMIDSESIVDLELVNEDELIFEESIY